MAANTSQGRYFVLLLVALTVACVGIASFSTGMGKLLLAVGVLGLLASLFGCLSIKSLEGKTAQRAGAEGMKIIGGLVALLGWGVTLFGLHIVSSVGGRIVLALIGIGVSLFGLLVILPSAVNKNAIWKM